MSTPPSLEQYLPREMRSMKRFCYQPRDDVHSRTYFGPLEATDVGHLVSALVRAWKKPFDGVIWSDDIEGNETIPAIGRLPVATDLVHDTWFDERTRCYSTIVRPYATCSKER